jgi:phage-related minor tail protein
MLQLDQIVFGVQTSELDAALTKVGQLANAVNSLNQPLDKAAKTSEKLANSQDRVATSAKSVSDSQEEVSKKTTASITALEKQQKILDYMTQGFSKGQSSILAMAEATGTATSDLNELGKVLQTQRKLLGGDPFDKSTSGLIALTTRLGEAREANRLYTAGIELTKAQTRELARDKERIIEKMKVEGASLSAIKDAIRAHNVAYIAAADAVNRLDQAERGKIKTDSDSAKAMQWVEREMNRVQNALVGMNDQLKVSTSNQLFRFEEQLRKSGVSATEAKTKIDDYKQAVTALNKEQKKQADDEMKRKMDYLSRGITPQISDIAVSLYGGMPLTTVMMQQGLQLRDIIAQSDVAAKDLDKVFSQAGKEFIGTLSNTASAVGSIMLGTLRSATDGAVNLAGSLVGVTNASGRLAQVAPGLLLSLTAGLSAAVIQAGALAVAFFQVQSSLSELNTALGTDGAALGKTKNEMLDLAVNSKIAGTSLTGVIDVFSQMVSAGKIPAEAYQEVAKAALHLSEVSGKSTEDIVKDFSKLAEDPIKVLSEYAVKSGEVSQADIERVKVLIEAGKETQALSEATDVLRQAIENAANGMEKSLTPIGQLWLTIKKGIGEAWGSLQVFSQSPVVVEPLKNVLQTVAVMATEVWFGIKGIAQSLGGLGAIAVAAFNDIRSGNLDFSQTKSVMASIKETDKARADSYQDAVDRILQLGKYSKENTEIELQGVAAVRKANSDAETQRLAYEKVMKDYRKDDRDADIEKLSRSEYITKQIERANKGLIEGNKLKEKDIALIKEIEGKRWDDKQKKEPKSDAQKELERIEKETQAVIKSFDAMRAKSSGYVENLSQAAIKLREIQQGESWQKMDASQKQRITNAMKVAEIEEHIAEMEKEKLKDQLALQKVWDDTVKKQAAIDKANFDALAVADEKYNSELAAYELMMLEFGLLGKTTEEQKRILGLKKIELEYEKDIADIKNKQGIDDPTRQALFDRALQTRLQKEKKLNTEIAQDAGRKLIESYKNIADGLADVIATALTEGGDAGAKSLSSLIGSTLKKQLKEELKDVSENTELGKFVSDYSGYLSAGMSLFSKNSKGGRDIGAAAGEAIGFAVGGPLGSAIGKTLGKALGLVDYGGTYHTGGAGGYSKATGTTTPGTSALGFNLSNKDISSNTVAAAQLMSQTIVGMLDSTAAMFGKDVGYHVATAFADDISPDGAWGGFFVKLGDKMITDWSAGQEGKIPKEFADGEEGLKQYSAAIGKSVKEIIIGITPDWADSFFNALGDNPTLEEIGAAYQAMNDFAMKIVGVSDDTLNGIFKSLIKGEKTATETGTALADAIVNGVKDSIASAGAQAMTDVAKQYMIMPLVNAIMSGGDITAAMNAIDFNRFGSVMTLISDSTMKLIQAGDWEGFKAAVTKSVGATNAQTDATKDATKASDTAETSTLKLSDALKGNISATIQAANGIDKVTDALKSMGLATNGLTVSSKGSSTGVTVEGSFAVGTNYVEKDMIAQIHQGERIIPATENAMIVKALKTGNTSAGAITSVFAGVGSSLLSKLNEILKELEVSGKANGEYVSGLKTAKEAYDNTMQEMQDYFANVGSIVAGQVKDWASNKYGTTGVLTNEQVVEFLKEKYQGTSDVKIQGFINAVDQFNNSVAKLAEEMKAKAEEILQPLRDDITGIDSNVFSEVIKQASEYAKSLDELGQATAENLAIVSEWQKVMLDARRSELYNQLLSEEANAEIALSNLTKQFTSLGIELPKSKDQFKLLLDGIDRTTTSGAALYDALLLLIPAFNEVTTSAEQAAKAAAQKLLDDAKSATDAAFSALQNAVNKQKELLNTQITTSNEAISKLKSVFDVLSSAVDDLYGTTKSTIGLSANQGRNVITTALTSGVLPTSQELSNAITAVKRGFDTTLYKTSADQQKAQLELANELEDLKTQAGFQLNTEELQLEELKKQVQGLDQLLQQYQDQINELRGINTSVLSVADAVRAMQEAIVAELRASQQLKGGTGGGTINYGGTPGPSRILPQPVDNTNLNAYLTAESFYANNATAQAYNPNGADASAKAYWGDRILDVGAEAALAEFNNAVADYAANNPLPTIPAYADGGFHSGGLRLVGEVGPELEVTGPARYYSASQTASMLNSNSSNETAEQIDLLRYEVRAMVTHVSKLERSIDRLITPANSGDNALTVRVVV